MKSPKKRVSQRKTDDSFCRTVEEEKVQKWANKLVQGENGLEVYVMIEIPSNVIFDEFASLIFYRFQ
jgi:phosphoenolpyruvate synthase/pyruvate phosphate dikinase